MKILICIDDTDNIESRGTGEIAELLADAITGKGWGECGQVTRHQLLLHPDIPYTSHNSSMCFPAEIQPELLDCITSYFCRRLAAESAPESDPGLCVLVPERLIAREIIVQYGQQAKVEVLSKQSAYDTAVAQGIHLSEHGGTGQGVIGALAGAGLRLSGNDGRFKGKLSIPCPNGLATVREIRAAGIDEVQTVEQQTLFDREVVQIGDWVKPILRGGKVVLLVVPDRAVPGVPWKAAGRKVFSDY